MSPKYQQSGNYWLNQKAADNDFDQLMRYIERTINELYHQELAILAPVFNNGSWKIDTTPWD